MRLTIADLARALGVEPMGDGALVVTGLAEPADAGPDDLALAMSPKYAETLKSGAARAAVVWPGADWQAMGLLAAVEVGRARLAMSDLTAAFDPGPDWPSGIHPTAIIDPSAELAADVSVGAYAMIGARSRIGPGGRIGPQVYIGTDCQVGAQCLMFPGARLVRNVTVGDRFIIHANAAVGSDGFSFVTEDVSIVETVRKTMAGDTGGAQPQSYRRIHSLGGVVIGDDVEIGPSTVVDSGTIRPTRIGSGTKLDSLVMIGHNCEVGEHTLICSQSGIAGSTTVGSFCVLAGQVGIGDHLSVGDRVVAAAKSGILSNVPAGRAVMGYPAVRMESHVESYKAIRRLPRILDQLRGRQKPVSNTDESD